MNEKNAPIWLSDSQVQKLLTPENAYEAVKQALLSHDKGEFVQPLKPYIRPQGREHEYNGGRFIAMPAYTGGDHATAGIKWIAGFPANIERGLPRASGVVALNSTETGRLLALMPCETLSARRTAAVAALSIDHLSQSTAKKIALIGAGPINRAVLESLDTRDRNVVEVRLCDLRTERAEEIARTCSRKHLPPCSVHTDAQEALQDANVFVTATTGSAGYLKRSWLIEKGWLDVALSLDDCQPEVMISADKIIVDDFEQSCREEKLLHRLVRAGTLTRSDIAGTLGAVMAKKITRESDDENIYVNPMGMGIEDIAVAQATYNKAMKEQIGLELPS